LVRSQTPQGGARFLTSSDKTLNDCLKESQTPQGGARFLTNLRG